MAQEFGLTEGELKRLNNLTENVIRWNDRLRVRAEDNTVPVTLQTTPSPPTIWYRVGYGETLEEVAHKFGLTVSELKRLNNLTENVIRWNDQLRVRAEDDSAPVTLKTKPSSPTIWYRVGYGETLEEVAQEFNLTVLELKRLNNLTEDTIRWNDRLRIRRDENPRPPPSHSKSEAVKAGSGGEPQ